MVESDSMMSDFSIALSKFGIFSSNFPFPVAIRQAEKEGQQHIVVYVPDEVYDSNTYPSIVPPTFDGIQ
ncbi:MAG: hypothetical protein HYT72_05245 [Candidatus Aenigmarchaeota archaeon]|nr:hypothetical protein [Candidatus Aenigmarchaeota archaeon]